MKGIIKSKEAPAGAVFVHDHQQKTRLVDDPFAYRRTQVFNMETYTLEEIDPEAEVEVITTIDEAMEVWSNERG
jgi:hypothetical protein